MKQNIEDNHLKLLVNQPIYLEGIGSIFSPTLKKVIAMGYENYNQILSTLLFDKDGIESFKNVEESNFRLACYFFMQDKEFRKIFKKGINILLDEDIELVEINDNPVLKITDSSSLNDDNFDIFQEAVMLVNKVKLKKREEEKFTAGNSKAREMIERIKKGKEKKPKKKEMVNLHSLISGLSWKSSSGVNIFNISELTIYQFYDGYERLENIEHYNNTVNGIYSGNIDPKKISMEQINWARIIN